MDRWCSIGQRLDERPRFDEPNQHTSWRVPLRQRASLRLTTSFSALADQPAKREPNTHSDVADRQHKRR
jgi:hypothetical protein